MSCLKVSIMIPTYNRAAMLNRCLKSCLEQTYPNLEIIVSDNASTDNTENIIREYLKDARFKYYRQENNIYIEQWKKLLYEYSTGDYGILIPDDDYLLNKNHVSEAASLIKKYQVDFVLSNCYFFDEEKGINKKPELNFPTLLSADWAVQNIGRASQYHVPFLPGLSAVFNIRKARELRAFNPSCYGLDYEIGIKFMITGNTAYLGGAQRMAVGHSGNDSRTNSLSVAMEGSKMFDRLYSYGLSIGHDGKELKYLRKRCIATFLSSFVSNIWYRDKGVSFKSMIGLYRFLKNNEYISLNRILCFQIVLRRTSILVFIRYRDEKFYLFLRKIYRWINKFNKNIEVIE